MAVIGVSGVGKSTVGSALATRLAVPFLDADVLHSAESIAKMGGGVPLDDLDRWPWLDRVGAWLSEHDPTGGVLACSALRRSYRDRLLRWAPRTRVIHLAAEHTVTARRLTARSHHFMPASLLESQLATLEPLQPEEPGITVDAEQSVDAIVDEVVAYLVS